MENNLDKLEKEKEYYDKMWRKMDSISSISLWAIILSPIVAFSCIAVMPTIFTLFIIITIISIVAKIISGKLSDTYYKKYKDLEKQIDEQKELLKEQKIHEQQEKNKPICEKEGHNYIAVQSHPNESFCYKPELFECLPLDLSVTEKCQRCGDTRKKPLNEAIKLNISSKLYCPIEYNGNVVARYELSLDLDRSYCMRAKKDIPSYDTKKGDLILVLNPKNEYNWDEEGLALYPDEVEEQTDRIYDDEDMPGLVKLTKRIALVDDETNKVLNFGNITLESVKDHLGIFKIEPIRIPERKCTVKVVCSINM